MRKYIYINKSTFYAHGIQHRKKYCCAAVAIIIATIIGLITIAAAAVPATSAIAPAPILVSASESADSTAKLLAESDDAGMDDLLEGFDPDADFGGLGFSPADGPGVIRISVTDTEGDYINGIVITEDGFRTDKTTSGNGVCEISQAPYGERTYGVYLTYSFDIDSVSMLKRVSESSPPDESVAVAVGDAMNLPPVSIADDCLYWEITFILTQSMRIKSDYFLVSPNDRFYYFRDDQKSDYADELPGGAGDAGDAGDVGDAVDAEDMGDAGDAEDAEDAEDAGGGVFLNGYQGINYSGGEKNNPEFTNSNERGKNPIDGYESIDSDKGIGNTNSGGGNWDNEAEGVAAPRRGYRVNTFAEAPVRIAVYVEMPALKGVCAIRVEGDGFGGAGDDGLDAGNIIANDDSALQGKAVGKTSPSWEIEGEYGDFSLPDLTLAQREWQLISDVNEIRRDDATFIRFFIVTLPSAYEGAKLRFERIVLLTEDGGEISFSNPIQSYLTVHIIPTPSLL